MYVVVYGLRNAGLTDALGSVIQTVAEQGLFVATVGMGFIAAILSSIMNNMPTVMIDALAIQGTQTDGFIREALIYANVIGSDLGTENYANRLLGHAALAACPIHEKRENQMGLLF